MRDITESMQWYLPKDYEDILDVTDIIRVQAQELKNLKSDTQDVLNQFHIDTATWGIAKWLKLVGLPETSLESSTFYSMEQAGVTFGDLEGKTWSTIELSYSPTLEANRKAVKLRVQGEGTINKAKIVQLFAQNEGGQVVVKELFDDYKIEIEFIAVAGIPTNIDFLQNLIREIVPAHLEIDYVFRFLIWDEFDSYQWTWDELDSKELTWDEFDKAVNFNG